MARARASTAVQLLDTQALILRRVGYAESDFVLTLFTEQLGHVSALARSARKSRKRFGGTLEPLHTLRVRLEERTTSELLVLRDSSIVAARRRLTMDLDGMAAAGAALGWVRLAAPPRTPEPGVWRVVTTLLDRLDTPQAQPRLQLAEYGLQLLGALGWGLDLQRCVRCGRACPAPQAAMVDPARGGLTCRGCGGARLKLAADRRARLAEAAAGHVGVLEQADVADTLQLIERALQAHVE